MATGSGDEKIQPQIAKQNGNPPRQKVSLLLVLSLELDSGWTDHAGGQAYSVEGGSLDNLGSVTG